MTESVDQGLADLAVGEDNIEAKLDALSAEETKELDFLATLEQQRGTGQLAPDQQARLDDLKARQAKVSAALDAAREELAQADGSEPASAPVDTAGDGTATGAAPVVASDTPIADAIPEPAPVDDHGPDGTMSGGPVESVHDAAGEEPAANEN